RKTLEFLLATELRNREIVLGKLASRLLSLTLFLLTGLPILSLTQLWGGVDVGVLLLAFACTGVTMLSLAALSTLISVQSRKPRDAIVLTYLSVAGYLGATLLMQLLLFVPGALTWTLTSGEEPLLLKDVLDPVIAGNPGTMVYNLLEDLRARVPLQTAL